VGAEWSHPGNRLVNVTAGSLNLVDVTVESESSFHIGGIASVSWTGNTDGGMNGFGGMKYPPPYFDIAPSATGRLTLVNQEFSRGAGFGRECRAPFVSRNITDASPGSCRLNGQTLDCGELNSTFRVVFQGLVLRDWTWTAVCGGSDGTLKTDPTCGYYPVARGVNLEIESLLMTTWHYDSAPDNYGNANISLQSERLFAPGRHSLLRGVYDVSGATVKPQHGLAQTPVAAGGGWSTSGGCAASASSGCSFGPLFGPLPRTTAGLQPGPAPFAAVQLVSGNGWVNATLGLTTTATAPITVEPGQNYVLSGWIQSNGKGHVTCVAVFRRFDGSNCSAATVVVMSLPSVLIGFHIGHPHWEPLLLPISPPGDAARMELTFGAQSGATMGLYALAVN